MLAFASLVVNCLLIFITSGKLEALTDLYTYTSVNISESATTETLSLAQDLHDQKVSFYELVIIATAEHIIFVLKYLIDVLIPDVPAWVQSVSSQV